MQAVLAALVAFSIFDALPVQHTAAPVPVTAYAVSGKGELTVQTGVPVTLGSIARGATRVIVGDVTFSASCDAPITLESLTVHHTGLGRRSDITGVYLLGDSRRLTRAARFDARSGDATLAFRGVSIPACHATTMQIAFDFSPTALVASEHGVSIESPSLIVSSAKQTTLAPVASTQRTFTTPYRQGTISVNFLPIRGPLRYGHRETVARMQITADAVASHVLKKITLTNEEQAHDMDLINFTLETTRGEKLSGPAFRMRGSTVTIEFDPSYELPSRSSVVLLLKADVRGSQRRGVAFTLEEPADLVSVPGHSR